MTDISVLNIYPKEKLDSFYELLCYLDEIMSNLIWWVEFLDCTGAESQSFCEEIEQKHGKFLDQVNLLKEAEKFKQILAGTFIGLSDKIEHESISLANFPMLSSPIAIDIIDGSYFDVYLRDADLKQRIILDFGAKENNLNDYFPHLDGT